VVTDIPDGQPVAAPHPEAHPQLLKEEIMLGRLSVAGALHYILIILRLAIDFG
jgi:hypothetical protein